METLTPGPAAYAHLLASLQKVRSISAENDTSQMYSDFASLGVDVPLGEKLVEDDRTVDLLVGLLDGTRVLEPSLWMNLAHMVRASVRWEMALAVRGVEMPDPADALRDAMDLTPA